MPHAHVLSSSLVGGGSMNPDKLSLDLNFAADKTLTARRGPTPILTRGTNATYVGSDGLIKLTTGVHQARFDHDPVTLACKGLLIEEGRTNLLWPSDTLTTQTRTVTAVAHTLSFYGTGTVILSGVATATVSGTGVYPTRTTLTFTPTAGSLILTVTGSIAFAQLEAGSFPTSYIPTTTGSLQRSADVCSISESNFTSFWNRYAGTAVVSISAMNSNGGRFIANEVSARSVELYKSGGNTLFFESSGLQEVIITNSSTIPFKVGLAYAINDYQGSFNGTLGGTDSNTGGTIPNSTELRIGNLNGANYMNGTISFIRYYKKRLPNAKLQTITV